MSFYQKSLRRISLALIALSILDAIFELVAYHWFRAPGAELLHLLQTPLGICLKDGIGVFAGLLALIHYRRKCGLAWIIRGELLLAIAVLLVILLSMRGQLTARIDGLMDVILVLMLLQMYTLLQLKRDDRLWQRVCGESPTTLDLKLSDSHQWFNSLRIGPTLALSEEVSSLVDRFLATATEPQPLEITIQCSETISAPLQVIMQEVFTTHYEDEVRRVNGYLESRYRRAVMLVIVSLIAVTPWTRIFLSSTTSVVCAILSNFAGFSLWQIGTTYFERSDGYKSLLRMMIAREAKLSFLTRS